MKLTIILALAAISSAAVGQEPRWTPPNYNGHTWKHGGFTYYGTTTGEVWECDSKSKGEPCIAEISPSQPVLSDMPNVMLAGLVANAPDQAKPTPQPTSAEIIIQPLWESSDVMNHGEYGVWEERWSWWKPYCAAKEYVLQQRYEAGKQRTVCVSRKGAK